MKCKRRGLFGKNRIFALEKVQKALNAYQKKQIIGETLSRCTENNALFCHIVQSVWNPCKKEFPEKHFQKIHEIFKNYSQNRCTYLLTKTRFRVILALGS